MANVTSIAKVKGQQSHSKTGEGCGQRVSRKGNTNEAQN